MDHVARVIGPLQTNTHLLADPVTRQALVIDAAIPAASWIAGEVAARGWRLVLIVSTHGHWDHTGDNAAVQNWTREREAATGRDGAPGEDGSPGVPGVAGVPSPPGIEVVAPDGAVRAFAHGAGAEIAAHRDDWYRLIRPEPLFAPFPIPPCIPAVDLAEGGAIRIGARRLEVLHTPGHTEGSVCLFDRDAGLLFAGDTLFPGGWGRVDLPGGDPDAMAESLARLSRLPDGVRVLPGHGAETTIGRERRLLDLVTRTGRLPEF